MNPVTHTIYYYMHYTVTTQKFEISHSR